MSGLLVVVSGPSGAGKSTVLKALIDSLPRGKFSVSMTTRAPRAGEINGQAYHFVTESQFVEMREAGGFLECARVFESAWYGTPKNHVLDDLSAGFDIILDIDVQGALQVRHSHPDAVFVFLAPPSMEELRRRLENRHTETPASLARRLETAAQEMERRGEYQYLVVNANDRAEETVDKLRAILVAEKCRTSRLECCLPMSL
ncbi:MAG TPA: guanylate kinase [Candidatus Xenobia bacterium]